MFKVIQGSRLRHHWRLAATFQQYNWLAVTMTKSGTSFKTFVMYTYYVPEIVITLDSVKQSRSLKMSHPLSSADMLSY